MDCRNVDFKTALRQWRDSQALSKLGWALFDQFGGIAFMSDVILQRIVDCVHVGKITTLEALKRES